MKRFMFLFCPLFLFGCATAPKDKFVESFQHVGNVKLYSRPIKLKKGAVQLAYMFEMVERDSLLIINEFPDPYHCMKIIDLRKGTVRNFGKKGKGPSEIQSGSCNFSIENNNLYVSDRINYLKYSIDSLKKSIDTPVSKFYFRPKETSFLNTTYCNGFVVGGTISNRIGLYNTQTKQVICKYDYEVGPMVEQAFYYNHPSKNIVAYFQSKSATMGILEIKNNDVTTKEYSWWKSGQKELLGDNGRISALPARDERNGFITAAVTEKFVYALYSGKVMDRRTLESLSDAFLSKYVYVFDWQGRLVKRYQLDQEVRSIAVNANDEALYAASYEGEPHLVVYKL
ncbi:MAG: BF3164 family lipoprotein [Mangrovibacterium sp.]